MPRRWLISIIILLLSHTALADEPIPVGLSVPLTGPAATYGSDVERVIRFADEKLGAGRFRFIVEDDHCDPKTAVTIAQKFIAIDKVRFVIGIPCSGTVLASAPLYEKAKVVVISALAGAPNVRKAGEYIFSTRPNDDSGIELLARHISKKQKALAVLVEQTDWAVSVGAQLVKNGEENGLFVLREEFPGADPELKPLLLRFKAANLNAVCIIAQTETSLAIAVKQIKESGWNPKIYSLLFPASATFLKLAGTNAEGIEFAVLPTPEELSPTALSQYREFIEKKGPLSGIPYIFWTAYEAFNSLQQAARSPDVKGALESNTFNGIIGAYRFDHDGIIIGPDFVISEIRNGKPAVLY